MDFTTHTLLLLSLRLSLLALASDLRRPSLPAADVAFLFRTASVLSAAFPTAAPEAGPLLQLYALARLNQAAPTP